jgi:hypothetical protein
MFCVNICVHVVGVEIGGISAPVHQCSRIPGRDNGAGVFRTIALPALLHYCTAIYLHSLPFQFNFAKVGIEGMINLLWVWIL